MGSVRGPSPVVRQRARCADTVEKVSFSAPRLLSAASVTAAGSKINYLWKRRILQDRYLGLEHWSDRVFQQYPPKAVVVRRSLTGKVPSGVHLRVLGSEADGSAPEFLVSRAVRPTNRGYTSSMAAALRSRGANHGICAWQPITGARPMKRRRWRSPPP